MIWVADYSFARPSLQGLKDAGCSGIVRYATGAGKGVERAEVDTAIGLGLTVLIVQESGNQPAMAGFNGGVSEALSANAACDRVGYPDNCWIVFVAEDPNILPVSAWPTVVSYFQGVLSASKRPVGGYGSLAILDHLGTLGLITRKWAVGPWGGYAGAHLAQYAAPVPPQFANVIDANLVLADDYGQHPRPGHPPQPQETDMPTFATGQIPAGFGFDDKGVAVDITKVVTMPIPPPGGGGAGWGNLWLSLGCDFHDCLARVGIYGAHGWKMLSVPVAAAGPRVFVAQLHQGDSKISICRQKQTATDTADNAPLSWMIEAAAAGVGGPVPGA